MSNQTVTSNRRRRGCARRRHDVSLVRLIEDAWGGHLDNRVKFEFATTAKGGVRHFLSIELEKCGLSGYQVVGGEQGTPTEQITSLPACPGSPLVPVH